MIVKAVAMIIKNDEGKVLLVRRGSKARSHHGTWENVGGEVEANEDPRDAIVREVREEIGVEVEIIDEILAMEDTQVNGEVWLAIIFEGRILTGTPELLEEGKHLAVQWFTLEELKDLNLSPYAREDFERLGWF